MMSRSGVLCYPAVEMMAYVNHKFYLTVKYKSNIVCKDNHQHISNIYIFISGNIITTKAVKDRALRKQ